MPISLFPVPSSRDFQGSLFGNLFWPSRCVFEVAQPLGPFNIPPVRSCVQGHMQGNESFCSADAFNLTGTKGSI